MKTDLLLTVAEYLAMEATSLEKHEYHDGEIYAMAGGTPNHSLLANNAGRFIGNALSGKACRVFNSDLMLAMSESRFVYPDLTVVCGKPEFYEVNSNAINNPTLIVEILSESTADYDRGGKFTRYRKIETLQEYVLIEQETVRVEVWHQLEKNVWRITTYESLEQHVALQSLGVEVAMLDLYENIAL